MGTLKKTWVVVIAAFLLAGCVTRGTASLKDLPADWPPIGTTKEDVRAKLGQPSSQTVTVLNGVEQEAWSYRYAEAQAHPLLFVPLVGLAVAASGDGVKGQGKSLVISFDPGGKVISRTSSTNNIGRPQ